MPKTIYRQATEEVVDELIESNPNWGLTLLSYQRKLKRNFWPAWYVNMIMQKFISGFDIYDAYSFAQIHSMIHAGHYAVVPVSCGNIPAQDSMIEENNSLLKGLAKPFKGEFWGGLSDCDGSLSWLEKIDFVDPNSQKRIIKEAGSCPLEVGYTKPERTYFHLCESQNGLARWPYDSDIVYFIMRITYRFHTGNIVADRLGVGGPRAE